MDKRDLMAHWDEIATDSRLTLDRASAGVKGYEFVTTGGSSGPPTVVAWDLDGWSTMAGVVMRAGMWFARGKIPARSSISEMVERLNEIQPHGLFGYASAIATMAGEALAGRLAISPMLIGTSSEPLLASMAGLIRTDLASIRLTRWPRRRSGRSRRKHFPVLRG